jgi:hypothetical protein
VSSAGAKRRWSISAVLGTAMGLLPHLLHHAGLLAGTALLAGIGGTVLFGLLGLVTMVPVLLRLRRRFRGWWAPAVAVMAFAAMFLMSALLVGPALRDAMDPAPEPRPHPSAPAGHQHSRQHN